MAKRELSYKETLDKRERDLTQRIKDLDSWLDCKSFTDQWWEKHSERNNLAINLMTVKSRLKHLGKSYQGIATAHIDSKYLKD